MVNTTLERVAVGDAEAVTECLHKYGGLVWSLARKLSASHEDAEDAVQEVFIEVWRKAQRYDPQLSSEATYITMVARNRLIDRYRRQRRKIDTSSIREELVESQTVQSEPVELAEEAALAPRAVEMLKPEQRQVLELSITHGLTQSQIATTTNLPLGTVKTHARRGLIRLRELLGATTSGDLRGDTQ